MDLSGGCLGQSMVFPFQMAVDLGGPHSMAAGATNNNGQLGQFFINISRSRVLDWVYASGDCSILAVMAEGLALLTANTLL